MIKDERELISGLLGVFGMALVLNHVDDLFGREVRGLLWLYAVAAVVDLIILCAYLYQRRSGRGDDAGQAGTSVR